MKISPDSIVQQDLIGLQAHIVSSSDPGHICRRGVIVDEARKVVHMDIDSTRIIIPKKNTVFQFRLPTGEQLRVNGNLLIGRPEERMKKQPPRRW
jgi:ribonuclease P protein subunit POP4